MPVLAPGNSVAENSTGVASNASTGIVEQIPTIEGVLAIEPNAQNELADEMPVPFSRTGWRIEVYQNGRFFQFRSGTGTNRISAYGGKFSELESDRQAQYQKRKKARRKAGQKGRT